MLADPQRLPVEEHMLKPTTDPSGTTGLPAATEALHPRA